MTEETRNIPATKEGSKATLTASQVKAWKAAGWAVQTPPKSKDEAARPNNPK